MTNLRVRSKTRHFIASASAAFRRLAAIVVLGIVAGCGLARSTPDKVVKNFYDHANQGRYDQAQALLCDELVVNMKMRLPQFTNAFQKLCDGATRNRTLDKVEILLTETRENAATVQAILRFRDGTTVADTSALRIEKGQWRLVR